MGAISHSVTATSRHLESTEYAVFPFDASSIKYNAANLGEIDPTRQYPKEYEKFMTREGTWDLYGVYYYAYNDMSTEIDEAEVARIIAARKQKLEEKQL